MGRILSYGLILLAIVVAGALAWLYTPDEQRAVLTAEYAQPPSVFLDVAEVRLHVRDTGPRAAPAVILLHGFGASLQTWEDWAQDLQRDHRVIRYDMPGFGLTGADPSGDYTDARSIAVLLALMDRLGVARASVVGNSMVGRIAWTFAALHPERTDKLVLVSPDGFASSGLEYGAAPGVPLMMRALPYVLPSFMLRASLAPAYANADVMTDALFTRYRDMMQAPRVRRAIVQRMGQQVLADPAPLLKRIEAPTLLMWGEKDGMIPFANSADCMRALPHATLAALPGIRTSPAGGSAGDGQYLAGVPGPVEIGGTRSCTVGHGSRPTVSSLCFAPRRAPPRIAAPPPQSEYGMVAPLGRRAAGHQLLVKVEQSLGPGRGRRGGIVASRLGVQ